MSAAPNDGIADGDLFGWAAAQRGTELAGRKWTAREHTAVTAAIRAVALRLAFFTSQDVWIELGPAFRVTKGMTGKLLGAAALGFAVMPTATPA